MRESELARGKDYQGQFSTVACIFVGCYYCSIVLVNVPIAVTEIHGQKQLKRERSTFWLTVPRHSLYYGGEVEATGA